MTLPSRSSSKEPYEPELRIDFVDIPQYLGTNNPLLPSSPTLEARSRYSWLHLSQGYHVVPVSSDLREWLLVYGLKILSCEFSETYGMPVFPSIIFPVNVL